MTQDSLIASIQAASKELAQQLEIMHHALPYKLSTSQRCALMELDAYKLMSSGQLAGVLRLDKSTVSRLVAPLVQQGFCTMQTNPDDLRNKLLSLTQKGIDLVKKINATSQSDISDALALLNTKEKNKIAQALTHYAQLLKKSYLKKNCKIRKVAQKNVHAVPYFAQLVQAEGNLDDAHPIAQHIKMGAKKRTALFSQPRSAFFVVECDKEVLGYAGYCPSYDNQEVCIMKRFYLSPQIRGNGIETLLVKALLQAAKTDGYRLCYREAYIPATQATDNLCEKLGFKKLDKPFVATDNTLAIRWYIKEL